jgi:hypothetical protein
MFELSVTSLRDGQSPSVVFEHADYLVYLRIKLPYQKFVAKLASFPLLYSADDKIGGPHRDYNVALQDLSLTLNCAGLVRRQPQLCIAGRPFHPARFRRHQPYPSKLRQPMPRSVKVEASGMAAPGVARKP